MTFDFNSIQFIHCLSSLLGCVLLVFTLWIFFLAVMALDRAHYEGKLKGIVMYPGCVILAIGLVIDVICQITIFTVICLDLPREPTVSQRLTRYKNFDKGWRRKFALWFAHNFLDPFDRRGSHI